jgi:hypothetical protein
VDVGQGGGGELAETIDTMTGKATYWVERSVILAEKLNSFERNFLDTYSAFNVKLGGELPDESYQTVDDFSTDETKVVSGGAGPAGPAADIASLKQNKNPLEDIGGSSEDNLFADIPAEGGDGADGESSGHTGLTGIFERNELHPVVGKEPAPEKIPSVPKTVETAAASPEEMFEEMDAPADAPAGFESDRYEAPPGNVKKDNVYDLYELGAVDYEPTIHHSA